MQLRKKILSQFLLALYLLVVLHQSTVQARTYGIFDANAIDISHKHEDFKEVHHEHNFHVGIFHFLGHLFENINESNAHTDKHLITSQKNTSEKTTDYIIPGNFYFIEINSLFFEVDAESLPAPPEYLSILQKAKRPNTPLRAPPRLF